jgi:hypothetical protein
VSGSKRYFAYFDDGGDEHYAQLDESVAESTALGFGVSVTPAVYADPGRRLRVSGTYPIEMRYVLAERVDGDGRVVRRKFRVGATSASIWSGSPYGVTVDGETWNVTTRVGEKRFYAPAQDTGLIDGDVDDNITAVP